MDKKNIDYCINQILDTLRKTKSIYRTNKEETAFDRSIALSEENCERLRTELVQASSDQSKLLLADVSGQLKAFAKHWNETRADFVTIDDCDIEDFLSL